MNSLEGLFGGFGQEISDPSIDMGIKSDEGLKVLEEESRRLKESFASERQNWLRERDKLENNLKQLIHSAQKNL